MTPKEKAEELVNKYLQYTPSEEEFEYPYAKQCALIAVDEIIKSNPCKLDGFEYERNTKYWEEVKQEIENL